MAQLDTFTRAFFECALWSSTDESREDGGDPLDANYGVGDIDPACLAALAAECAVFQEQNAADLAECWGKRGPYGRVDCDDAQAGHDFWLTRCGHGCGYWDGDWPEGAAERLTASSKAFGNVDLYVGDDGLIYAAGYEGGHHYRATAHTA